ncbi:TPA: hypothetical protein ACGXEV_000359 [Pseudomonas aeruginosa]
MDTNKLKELAERALTARPVWYSENGNDWFLQRECMNLLAAANPQAILGLIADLEEARNGMEYQPIMRLKNELDRLKAENKALRGALEQLAEMLNSIHVPIDLNEILKGTTK